MSVFLGIFLSLTTERVISSVGLERCIDIAEVAGSNPVLPTIKIKKPPVDTGGFFILMVSFKASSR
jgi:hypothetical protein